MREYEAYDVKARKKVKILEPKSAQPANKRWALKGKSAATGYTLGSIEIGGTKSVNDASLCAWSWERPECV